MSDLLTTSNLKINKRMLWLCFQRKNMVFDGNLFRKNANIVVRKSGEFVEYKVITAEILKLFDIRGTTI